jgi:hypothetical protein
MTSSVTNTKWIFMNWNTIDRASIEGDPPRSQGSRWQTIRPQPQSRLPRLAPFYSSAALSEAVEMRREETEFVRHNNGVLI